MPSPLYNDASLAEADRKRKVFTDWAGVPLPPEKSDAQITNEMDETPNRNRIIEEARNTLVHIGISPDQVDDAVEAAHPGSTYTHETSLGPAYQAKSGDTPLGAAGEELWRTLGATGVGVLKSPVSAMKGVLGAPKAIYEGLTQDIPELIKDPSLVVEAPRALVNEVADIGRDPESGGNLLGQLALARVAPEVAKEVPGVAGNVVGATGRGMERLGTSKPMKTIGRLGPWEAVARGDWKGMAAAALPSALEYGGQGLQRLGTKISGKNQSLTGLRQAATESSGMLPIDEAANVRDTVNTARAYMAKGATRRQAAQRAGWPLGKSTETPIRAGSGVPTTQPFEGRMPDGELSTPEQRAAIRALKKALYYHDPRDPLLKGEPSAAVGGIPVTEQELLDTLRRGR